MNPKSVPREILDEAVLVVEQIKNLRETNKLSIWKPWPKQLEFLNLKRRCKVLLGGNQVGKTLVGSSEIATHATGRYPKGWKGIRFDHPVEIWVAGVDAERVRDTIQEKLLGPVGKLGTGFIPLDCLDPNKIIRKPGMPQCVGKVYVKSEFGGDSCIQFFSFKQGQEDFMGSTIDMVWYDEEPPEAIRNECRMRIMVKKGYEMFTFTPLKGITPLYDNLLTDENVDKVWISVDDAPHLDLAEIEKQYVGLSESEKRARKYGIATAGEGRVFQFEEEMYSCEPFEIPRHWRKIGGMDIGLSHPTTAIAIAIDDESGCHYVYKEYCKSGEAPRVHAAELKNWGIEFALDSNAWSRQIGSGEPVARMYQGEGLRVFKALNEVNSVSPSITKIRTLISEGLFWIFTDCTQLLREMRVYRTKEGADGKQKIVKVMDDTVDAMRYAIMSRDKASVGGFKPRPKVQVKEFKPSSDKYSGY